MRSEAMNGAIEERFLDCAGRLFAGAKGKRKRRPASLGMTVVMRLAFLEPKIVERIAAGRQPSKRTAEASTERIDLPLLWTAQEEAVGV